MGKTGLVRFRKSVSKTGSKYELKYGTNLMLILYLSVWNAGNNDEYISDKDGKSL